MSRFEDSNDFKFPQGLQHTLLLFIFSFAVAETSSADLVVEVVEGSANKAITGPQKAKMLARRKRDFVEFDR